MTILTPEVRALLKRMDADDAMEAAALAGWNAAIEAAAETCIKYQNGTAETLRFLDGGYHVAAARNIEAAVLALKDQK